MNGNWYHCAGCGRFLPEDQIDINGRCPECWRQMLEEHDARMKTIAWREQEARHIKAELEGGERDA